MMAKDKGCTPTTRDVQIFILRRPKVFCSMRPAETEEFGYINRPLESRNTRLGVSLVTFYDYLPAPHVALEAHDSTQHVPSYT